MENDSYNKVGHFLLFVQLHNKCYNPRLGIAPGAPARAGLHFGGGPGSYGRVYETHLRGAFRKL